MFSTDVAEGFSLVPANGSVVRDVRPTSTENWGLVHDVWCQVVRVASVYEAHTRCMAPVLTAWRRLLPGSFSR